MRRFLAATVFFVGCASPFGGEDVDVSLGLSTLPGLGATLGLSQRIVTARGVRYDVGVDLTHQELDDPGPDGDDDWRQFRLGFSAGFFGEQRRGWIARAGLTWVRAQGDPGYLDTTGDFGGGYMGLGYRFPLSRFVSFEPDISVLVLDAEGGGDFGYVPELTWRLVWHL